MEILGDITINVKQSDNILCKNIFASFHKNKKDLIIRGHFEWRVNVKE